MQQPVVGGVWFTSCCCYRVLRAICCQAVDGTAASSASCKRSRLPSKLVNGQELTMCDIVWISRRSHTCSSLSVKPHFLWHALQWPWPVCKRFSSDHWRRWRSKPGSQIVGSTTKVEFDHRSRLPVFPPPTCDINWLQVPPQWFAWFQAKWRRVKDVIIGPHNRVVTSFHCI